MHILVISTLLILQKVLQVVASVYIFFSDKDFEHCSAGLYLHFIKSPLVSKQWEAAKRPEEAGTSGLGLEGVEKDRCYISK